MLAALVHPALASLQGLAAQTVREVPEIRKSVSPGVRTRVFNIHGANAQCVQVRGFTVEVTKAPTKGDVALEKEPFVVDEVWLNSVVKEGYNRAKQIYDNCKGKSFLKIQIYYTSRMSRTDSDYLEFNSTSASGERMTRYRMRLVPR